MSHPVRSVTGVSSGAAQVRPFLDVDRRSYEADRPSETVDERERSDEADRQSETGDEHVQPEVADRQSETVDEHVQPEDAAARQPEDESEPSSNGNSGWIDQLHQRLDEPLALATKAVGLIAVLIYGCTYFLSLTFYSTFGVTPEDVAWSETRAAVKSVVFAVMIGIPVLVLNRALNRAFARLDQRVARWLDRHPGWQRFRLPPLAQRILHKLRLLPLVAFLVVLFIMVTGNVLASATRVRDVGRNEGPWINFVAPAGIAAPVGFARWTEADDRGRPATRRSQVWLLGQANGTSVFYDGCLRRTIRVPTGVLVFEQSPSGQSDGNTALRELSEAEWQEWRKRMCRSLDRPFA